MTENKSSESREFTRVPIKVWVEVRAKDTVLKTHESHDLSMVGNRSEERRVGKECRSGWSPNQ